MAMNVICVRCQHVLKFPFRLPLTHHLSCINEHTLLNNSLLNSNAGSARGAEVSPQESSARARRASRYMGYMLGNDGKPRVVVALDQRRLMTYAHKGHASLSEGDIVQVCGGVGEAGKIGHVSTKSS